MSVRVRPGVLIAARSDVPIVNLVSIETMIAKVSVEAKPQTIVMPTMPMYIRLNHNISPDAYRRRCGRRGASEVRAADADGKSPGRRAGAPPAAFASLVTILGGQSRGGTSARRTGRPARSDKYRGGFWLREPQGRYNAARTKLSRQPKSSPQIPPGPDRK